MNEDPTPSSPLFDTGMVQWSPPLAYQAGSDSDMARLRELIGGGRVSQFIGASESNVGLHRIVGSNILSALDIASSHDSTFFYFPWSGEVIEYPSIHEFRRARTDRNRDLITSDEQDALLKVTIAVFGLSVGSNVVERLVTGGIGGHYILADMDAIELTNLNRISATYRLVGESKVDWLAKRISEIDPYLRQHHLPHGVTAQILRDSLPTLGAPAVLVDEVDDFAVKFAIRDYARANRIPVVMATDVGDTVIFDVERHDLPGGAKMFGGRLKAKDLDLLARGDIEPEHLKRLFIRTIGPRHITTRLVNSGLDIGTRLSGMPQLGTTASMAGSVTAVGLRELLLGRRMPSGRYVVSLPKSLHLQRTATVREGLHALRRLIRSK